MMVGPSGLAKATPRLPAGGFAMILGWLLFGGSLPYYAWGTPWVVPAVLLWLGPPSLAVAVVIDDMRMYVRLDTERAESAHQPREANRALAEACRRWRNRP
jgi:mannose/fructose/N-acetylgalactosamine-specific phosphotransferase system component IIC